jgi:hypothetical protein
MLQYCRLPCCVPYNRSNLSVIQIILSPLKYQEPSVASHTHTQNFYRLCVLTSIRCFKTSATKWKNRILKGCCSKSDPNRDLHKNLKNRHEFMDFCGFHNGKYLVCGLRGCAPPCLVTTRLFGVTSCVHFRGMNFWKLMHKVTAISK